MNVRLMCPSKYAAQINSRPCLSRSLFPSPPIYLSTSLILRHHYIHNQIVQINGQDVRGLEMNQVLGLIQGAPGTMVSERERGREGEREGEREREKERERERLALWFSVQ
jgi:hypothetical protein